MCPGLRKSGARTPGDARVRQVRARSCADIPVVIEGWLESIVMVYAVPLGSVLLVTIWGRERWVAISGVMGAQIRPLYLFDVC